MAKRTRTLIGVSAILSAVLLLSGCGVQSGDQRPDNSNLIAGINLLVSSFNANHPKLATWKNEAVKAQLARKLPVGLDTEAGWLLQWPNATQGELSQVVVPWTLLGQYPNSPLPYFNHYVH